MWKRNVEGLFITSGLVILFTNLFNLGSIAMLGSASFLLIYTAVNIGHLRLYKETGASPLLIWTSIVGCLSVFGILVYYLWEHSILTLVVLALVVVLSFGYEWIYRRHTGRGLKTREIKQ